MSLIYKYTLSSEPGPECVTMPAGAVLLHVAAVNDVVCLWATVDPDAAPAKRALYLAGTGHDPRGEYVGTAVTLNGRLVWHVFDLGEV